jgi:hypothetical protein
MLPREGGAHPACAAEAGQARFIHFLEVGGLRWESARRDLLTTSQVAPRRQRMPLDCGQS